MEDLPPPLLLDIMSRLTDSTDLARCRLASRTLRSLSYQMPSVRILCSHDRFLRSRDPANWDQIIPFKTLVVNLVSLLTGSLESLAIGVEKVTIPGEAAWEDEDDSDDADDLHLTAVDFLERWVPLVGGRLRSLVVSDYWVQSCWRRSEALALISDLCTNLLELEVRNAWLSIDGIKVMPNLTSLTLEFIRLDDEDLNNLNDCFPSLEVLNLIGVGGLKEPKIHLLHLRICHWTVSNFPHSLSIKAPNLVDLELKCIEPKIIVLETPLLMKLNLIIKKPSTAIRVDRFLNLYKLRIESLDLDRLIRVFTGIQSVKSLELEIPCNAKADKLFGTIEMANVTSTFSDMNDLKLGPRVCWELQKSFARGASIGCLSCLKKLTVHLPCLELDISFISALLKLCTPSCEVAILFRPDSTAATRKRIFSKCACKFSKFRWKCGIHTWTCENFLSNT